MLRDAIRRIERISGDEHELTHLPDGSKRSILGLLAVWGGATIAPSSFLIGGSVGNSLTAPEFVFTFMLGATLMALLSISIGIIARDLGLTFYTMSRYFFGNTGSYIPSTLAILTRVGYAAATLAFAGSFVFNLINFDSFVAVTAVLGVLYTISALIGYDGLKWIGYVTIPVFLGVFLYGLLGPVGFTWQTTAPNPGAISLTGAIGISASFWAAGALVSADWLRYAKTKFDIVVSTLVALLIFNMIALGLGFFSVASTGNADIASGMVDAGYIVPAAIGIVLISWTTVDNWLYSGSLGASNIFNVRKTYAVLVLGLAIILTAGFQFHNYILEYVGLIGVLLPPLAGPILFEYYVLGNKMSGKKIDDINYRFNWIAVGAWLIGSLVGWYTPSEYVVPVVAIVASFLSYSLLYTLLKDSGLNLRESVVE